MDVMNLVLTGKAGAYLLGVCWEGEVHLVEVHLVCPETLQGGIQGITHGLGPKTKASPKQHVGPRDGEVFAGHDDRAAVEPLCGSAPEAARPPDVMHVLD